MSMNGPTSGYEARDVKVCVVTPGDGVKGLSLSISNDAFFQLVAGLCPEFVEMYMDTCSKLEISITFGEK